MTTQPPLTEPWRHETLAQLQADLDAALAAERERRAEAERRDLARWEPGLTAEQSMQRRDAWRRADQLYYRARRRLLICRERLRLRGIELSGGPRPCDHSVQCGRTY